jgi:allantoicase
MQHFATTINLAGARLGAEALATNDEFFAPKENLIKPEPPVFAPDRYTDRGKWMDGWETRRRRTPGHDWCILKLGLPGVIRSIVVDTTHFSGNYPSHCSLDACGVPDGTPVDDLTGGSVTWHPVLPQSELRGDAENTLPVDDPRRFTHVRLNIFPDGGVARLRVLGDAVPDWTRVLSAAAPIDLASVVNGAHIVDTSDRFFGEAANMLMPYPAANMGDGWETKRRRGPGHDWSIIHLAIEGAVHRIEIATTHFKGNYPESCSVDSALIHDVRGGVSADSSTVRAPWSTVLARTPLRPDDVHVFDRASLDSERSATHVRLNIFPDGGISRCRVFGAPTPSARRSAVLRVLNIMDEPDARATLANYLGSAAWIDRMLRARPFASAHDIIAASDAAAATLGRDDWLEAFRHHPRIGERTAERRQSEVAGAWSASEQSGVDRVAPADLTALAAANRDYERRFGHVYVVSAAGKSGTEILSDLRARLANDPAKELEVAAAEQRTITRVRFERVLG